MTKTELLSLLQDADVRKKIIEVVRFGVKTPSSRFAGQSNLKSDLLFLLCDEDVRKELLNILRGDEPKKISTPEPPKQITSTGADVDIMALREKIRMRVTQKPKPSLETLPAEDAEVKFTYISEKTCPICEERTRVVQCKSRLVADTLDLDFCMHYKNFNPYLYTIWVCEHCGYAADDNRFQERYADRVRKSLREFLGKNNFKTPFTENRTAENALAFYETAIYFNENFEPSFGRQAGLYQKMAWVCRIEGNTEKEKEYLLKCAQLYEISIDKERYPIGKVSDNFATFTIGANYFMLQDFDKATKYLNMIIGNQNLRSTSPKLYEKARDIWQDIRAMRK